jgi:acyl carrier protein
VSTTQGALPSEVGPAGAESAGAESGLARVERQDIFALVRDALAIVLERDPATITADTTLAELAADSLALVEVAEIVEEQLAARTGHRLHIPDADLEAFRTVGAAADYAAEKVGAAAWIG